MTTRTMSKTIGPRLWATAIVLALTAALAVTMLLAAGPAPASASVQDTTKILDSSLTADAPKEGERAKLRANLKAARKLTGKDRQEAIAKVRADAASGTYGDKIEKRAERRTDRRSAVLALLPDQLQADLKDLKAADQDERKKMRDDIRTKALAGGYGDKVQAAAKQLEDHWKK